MATSSLFVTLVLIAISMQTANSVKFSFAVEAYGKRCFSQLLTEATPFHFRIDSTHQNYQISLNHHDGTPLVVNQRPQSSKKIDSYASVTGQYYFCVIDQEGYTNNYTFEFYQGLQLSDLSSIPHKDEGALINDLVDKINELYQKISLQETYSHKVNEYNMELQKLVSFKSVGFVFLSITVVFIISFLHYLQIKRVLKNRKII